MRYVLMFCDTEEFEADWAALDQAGRDRSLESVYQWLSDYADKITHRVKLEGADTATTVRNSHGDSIVHDGPFVEGKEVVSGLVEVDVADLDEALRMAKSWPGCPVVEIRPVMM